MEHIPISLVFSLSSEDNRARISRSIDFFGKEEQVFDTDRSFQFLPDFAEGKEILLQKLSNLLKETRQSRVVVVSDELTTTAGSDGCKPSDLAKDVRQKFLPTNHLCGLVALVQGEAHRVTDIDRVIDVAGLEPSVVKDAITKAANSLWLKSPPSKQLQTHNNNAITVQVAQSKEQLRKCFELRYQVYDLMGYLEEEISASREKIEIDSFDQQAIHFAAIDHLKGEIVGTVRLVVSQLPLVLPDRLVHAVHQALTLQSEWSRSIAGEANEEIFRRKLNQPYFLPLPILQSSDFQGKWRDILRETRDGGELSRNVVLPSRRGLGVSQLLVRAVIATALVIRKKFLLLECVPTHASMYAKYGFEPLHGHHCRVQELDQVAVGMRLDLDDHPNNRAVSLAKRDIQLIQEGCQGFPLIFRYLCLCHNKLCWHEGQYKFRGRMECPLRDLQ